MELSKVEGIEVPWQNLSEDALTGVIDDFILREGTDYGAIEATHEKKREDILASLRLKKAKLFFDPETETITLVAAP